MGHMYSGVSVQQRFIYWLNVQRGIGCIFLSPTGTAKLVHLVFVLAFGFLLLVSNF